MNKPHTAPTGSAALDTDAVLAAIEDVLAGAARPVSLHEPKFTAREREVVLDCIDSNWVSTGGKYVERFEDMVRAYTGARHAIAIVNGTAALHAALEMEGVGIGDEVIIPAITFVATANAVSHAGAIPHFVDSTWTTLGLDPAALDAYLAETTTIAGDGLVNRKTGRRIKAVVPVHIFGHPVDMDALSAVAAKYRLTVVEDATESLGSTLHGKHCGTFGHSAVLSFNGNKIITTGGGGMILTDDDAYAAHARHVTTTAKLKHAWAFNHDEIGYNYRLPNLNAAIGCSQMERLPQLVEAKRKLAERYMAAFHGIRGIAIVREPADSRSNYWLNTLVLDETHAHHRDALLGRLHAAGIHARPLWTPMHELPMYREAPRAPLPVAAAMSARCINLPSSPFLMSSSN